MQLTPEKLAEALDNIDILVDEYSYYVIDRSTAGLDNWPGSLISEHETWREACIARARAIIATVFEGA